MHCNANLHFDDERPPRINVLHSLEALTSSMSIHFGGATVPHSPHFLKLSSSIQAFKSSQHQHLRSYNSVRGLEK